MTLTSPDRGRAAAAVISVETVRATHDCARVRVAGELDLSTSAPLWAVLDGHLAAGRHLLRLDLSGVTFLDASTLSGIARVHAAALDRRGTLVLTGVTQRIARILRLTGLDDVLFIGGPRADDDLDDAELTLFPARPVPWTPISAVSGPLEHPATARPDPS